MYSWLQQNNTYLNKGVFISLGIMDNRFPQTEFRDGLSYDDVLLRPRKSSVESRRDPEIKTQLVGDIEIDLPIVSSPMDTVTEAEMAQALADKGAVGIIHRFSGEVEKQAEEVSRVDGLVGASIGVSREWEDRAEKTVSAGADFLCVDVAHAHSELTLDVVSRLDDKFQVPIMAGNVATGQGAVDLVRAGADSVKVGVGPGSHCLTREVTGVGVPQLTAILEVTEALHRARQRGRIDDEYIPVVADGGIQSSGDIAKALVAGADTAMIGGMYGGCEESPAPVVEVEVNDDFGSSNTQKYKRTRGMSSDEARDDADLPTDLVAEGDSGLTPYKGSAESLTKNLASGVRISFSYLGAHDIRQARKRGEFITVSNSVQNRNGTHGVFIDDNEVTE